MIEHARNLGKGLAVLDANALVVKFNDETEMGALCAWLKHSQRSRFEASRPPYELPFPGDQRV